MDLPYLTAQLPGIGGLLKQRPEDFFVEEIPLYEPAGDGEHVYCQIEKRGLSTFDAMHRIADALGISSREIGYAGMKDTQAITRQVFSIQNVDPEQVAALKWGDLSVLWVNRHRNKLRLGHLAGNRFAIRLRQVDPAHVLRAAAILEVLKTRGMPNYFGEQRFGHRNNNDQLGAALIREDAPGLLKLLLGSPDLSIDDPQAHGARKAFEEGNLELAMKRYPRHCGMERRILARLIKTGRAGAAARAIDEKLRRLWVTALQSRLFNQVLVQRIESIDRLMDGDFAYKHENGSGFPVESAAAEQPRCDAWEISPTGPLVGYRMTLPQGRPLEIEQQVFAAAGLSPSDFRKAGKEKVKGSRRPLRVRPQDVDLSSGVDDQGPHVTIAFTLPAGSFATVLLRELMKV